MSVVRRPWYCGLPDRARLTVVVQKMAVTHAALEVDPYCDRVRGQVFRRGYR